jgi:hypothetical protein
MVLVALWLTLARGYSLMAGLAQQAGCRVCLAALLQGARKPYGSREIRCSPKQWLTLMAGYPPNRWFALDFWCSPVLGLA